MKPADPHQTAVLSAEQLSQLWQEHAPALLLLARSRCHAGEDCVQQAFVRLATMAPPPGSPLAWLATVVRNEAVSVARAESRRRRREHVAACGQNHWLEASAAHSTDALSAGDVQQALSELDEETREIVIARVWTSLTFREIAKAFGISHATAQRRYESGIAELRRQMEARL